MRIQPLPPLNSLVAFEASARNLSFTAAAKELNVTQGAVSRQIKLLEEYLGQSLFERNTREVSLSRVGAEYFETVGDVLKQLATATGEIRKWQGVRQITVMTSSAMAALWLLPKVADFQRLHEDIDLRIIAHDHAKDFSRLDCDLALYYCRTPPAGMIVTPLFREEVFPVCSPGYLAKYPHIQDLRQLDAATWLWLDDHQRDWIGWPQWFEYLGQPAAIPRRRVNINNYSMLIQSALSGQGIALAWSNLIADHLETGLLVKPTEHILRTQAMFCLLERPTAGARSALVQYFKEWVLGQVSFAHEKIS